MNRANENTLSRSHRFELRAAKMRKLTTWRLFKEFMVGFLGWFIFANIVFWVTVTCVVNVSQ